MVQKANIDVLERGHIYFFYRPKVHSTAEVGKTPHTTEDINRLYIILQPEKKKPYRLLIVGQKNLPEIETHEKRWASIDLVTDKRTELLDAMKSQIYTTKTRGERFLPEMRACGEGVYMIVYADNQTYLAYHLELPTDLGEVQTAFNLKEEASYVLSVKNQVKAGIQSGRKANYPERLKKMLGDLRFKAANPVELLNYPGAELLLVGAEADVKKSPGLTLKKEHETLHSADLFTTLKLWKNKHTVKPLMEGEWA